MAKKQSTSKPAPPETPKRTIQELLSAAEKEITAVVHQLEGLQSFLRALGEADAHHGVAELNDLCFGFSYLLGSTEVGAEHIQQLIAEATKGGK